ncbi:50S ribosomal protein L11 methyltransferase [Dellaglioa algida]|uniref:50S ribosomal protein L11 methyltransferase n=1 Tax=Dellaglioa algida TaxID=105612 RepID=UPI000BC3DB51|nr:50S ribosomal protein L11 methyltransferase [Dellaglioa algida]MDK1718106.1 50S ribosomal protein L11 methyltransferase [Dellaglioa algida]MDK1729125.1 50S ribosomal protein L11 methyltransferase [Dellaglioa algida]MDK1741559.1 50S ribosomal protein L11 methyltransferase [Dellaglioa algida]SOB49688.1 ribosomal protein L11 methyltransferase [Dellaglioa algida]
MKWTELSVLTSSEAVEAVSNILIESGAEGVQIDDSKDFEKLMQDNLSGYDFGFVEHQIEGAKVSAFFPEIVFIPEILPVIQSKVNQLVDFGLNIGQGLIESTEVDDQGWGLEWQQYYHPVRVTRFLTIVPSWEKYEPSQLDEKVIRLDPGKAFGTGTHPTTRLALVALEQVIRGGETMIDVGTGSGVLSIAAKHLGVGQIDAYDLDDIAVEAAMLNFDLNPVASDVHVAANDLLNGIEKKVDLIVANILSEIIVPLIPQAKNSLNSGGYFVTSGIIADKVNLIKSSLINGGFEIQQILNMGDWFSIIAVKMDSEG